MIDQLELYRSALAEKRRIHWELKARPVVAHAGLHIRQPDINERLLAKIEAEILELEAGIRRLGGNPECA
jgi:hypothetical protein